MILLPISRRARIRRTAPPAFFGVMLLFLFASFSAAASAPEWLRPFLSGEAAAWHPRGPIVMLLNRSEVHFLTLDRRTIETHAALRANTNDGVQQLRVVLPYNADYTKITTARAWIISSKGKVTPVARAGFTEQAAYADSRIWSHLRALTYIAPPDTEPGSVLAWEFAYEGPSPLGEAEWYSTSQYGLYRGEFDVVPAPNAKLSWHSTDPAAPGPQPGSAPGSLVWQFQDLKGVRGLPPEGFCAQSLEIRVRCSSNEEPSVPEAEKWNALAASWSHFYEEKAVTTAALQAIAEAEVQGKTTRWEKIRALTQYVQKKITYLAVVEEKDVFAGDRPHPAAQVAECKLGDCKDKVTLLIALLRAVGENGVPTLVFSGSPTSVNPAWPAHDFNHVIVALRSDSDVPSWWATAKGPDGSTLVLFDPTDRTLPLGCLPPSDQGGYGLFLSPDHGGLIRIAGDFVGVPPQRESLTIALQLDGTAKVSEVDEIAGTDGAIRQSIAQSLSKDQYTRHLEQAITLRGTNARNLRWSTGWDVIDARFTLRTDFEVPQAVRKVGADQMLWTPPFKKTRLSLTPWETSFPGVAWLPRAALNEEISVTLPAGVNLAELPRSIHMEEAGASGELSYSQNGSVITCVQHYVRPAGLYQKAEYDKLRFLGEKIVVAERRPIVLKSTAVAAVDPVH